MKELHQKKKIHITCLCCSYYILLFLLFKYEGSKFCSVLLLKTSVTLIYFTNDNLNYILAMLYKKNMVYMTR